MNCGKKSNAKNFRQKIISEKKNYFSRSKLQKPSEMIRWKFFPLIKTLTKEITINAKQKRRQKNYNANLFKNKGKQIINKKFS